MPLEGSSFGRSIVCDDPYRRDCKEEIGPYFGGEERVEKKAFNRGWFKSEETGKYACPQCMRHHRVQVVEHVRDRHIAPEEVDNSGDPFTAAFVAMLLGGDPLTAAGVAMLTGSNTLGVLAGVAAGGDERPPAEASAPEPLIVNPFVEERAGENVEADTPESSVLEEGPEATSFNEEPSGGGDSGAGDSSSTSY